MRVLSVALGTIGLGLAITVGAPNLAGQAKGTLAVGTRVRLFGPSIGTLTGPIRAVAPDTITLDLPRPGEFNHSTRPVPWSAVTKVEVSLQRHSHAATGALIGSGAALGLLAALAAGSEGGDLAPGPVLGAGVVLALPAMGLGALVGASIHHETWREVTPPARAGSF